MAKAKRTGIRGRAKLSKKKAIGHKASAVVTPRHDYGGTSKAQEVGGRAKLNDCQPCSQLEILPAITNRKEKAQGARYKAQGRKKID